MVYQTLQTELESGIFTIRLNRPERLNAFNQQMYEDLLDALDFADRDDTVRVVIVTGEGRAFCAGADLEKGGSTFESESSLETHRDRGGILALRIFELKKPVIAAINGAAVGVGITMTLPMDVRIAAAGAKMGFVFTRRGIVLESCSSWFLPRICGIDQALEWAMTGRVFSADEALAGGLVSQVVDPDRLLSTAKNLAAEIAENTSATSVTLSRRLMWQMLGASHPMEAHKLESKLMFWSGAQADAREGVSAFLEKRKARFTMKPSTDLPEFYP